MNTKKFMIAAAFLFAANTIDGAILTVDNNPNNSAQYSTFESAFAAANEYDTLLIQPSLIVYEDVQLNKPIAIIGRGNNAIQGWRTSFGITTISSSHVIIEGILIASLTIDNSSQIVVRNCVVNLIPITNSVSNVLFSGNLFQNGILEIASSASDILFLNNYFIHAYNAEMLNIQCETVFFNYNIFHYFTSGALTENVFFGSLSRGHYVNNVFYAENVGAMNPEDCICTFQNNLTYSPAGELATLPNSTLNNVAPTWDLGDAVTPQFSYDLDYNMLSGAPATGATDGGQVGVFGGGFNFQMQGFPPNFPRITSTNISTPVVFSNGEVEVEFEAEAGTN